MKIIATLRNYLAKVGVEGSNPFARSRIFKVATFDESPLTQRAFRCPGERLRRKAIRAARRRFSLPPDVLTFSGLIHLQTKVRLSKRSK
jgi:hypothetical protein